VKKKMIPIGNIPASATQQENKPADSEEKKVEVKVYEGSELGNS
jgi:hypothetical protein